MTAEKIAASLDALAASEPVFARGLERIGYPPPRVRARGYETLLRTIVGQQVSVFAADAVWRRLSEAALLSPAAVAQASEEALRACGLSRQKIGYARSLAEEVATGRLDLAALPAEDDAAIAALVRIKGIGRWSAEIYLLFAEGRTDIWPAGDLAVQIEVGHLLDLPERPREALTRQVAERWRPHRGAAALFAWHHYGHRVRGRAAPDADKSPL